MNKNKYLPETLKKDDAHVEISEREQEIFRTERLKSKMNRTSNILMVTPKVEGENGDVISLTIFRESKRLAYWKKINKK